MTMEEEAEDRTEDVVAVPEEEDVVELTMARGVKRKETTLRSYATIVRRRVTLLRSVPRRKITRS